MSVDAGSAIRMAVRHAFVWTIYSEANQETVDSLSRSNLRDKISLSILHKDSPMPRDLGTLVDLAIEHHGTLPEIGIIGYGDGDGADAIMAEYGYGRLASGGTILKYRKLVAEASEP